MQFFQQYEKLLTSDNYVTRRQSLKVSLLVCDQHPCVGQSSMLRWLPKAKFRGDLKCIALLQGIIPTLCMCSSSLPFAIVAQCCCSQVPSGDWAVLAQSQITPCCVQLLGELLLDRANVKVMMRYVSDSANLQMMMMLLKDNSRSIQFEAFHVFKVPSSAMCKMP